MERAYHKWFSPILEKFMEILVFGQSGTPVIFFPTRSAHFYDFENWKIIDALKPKIEAGEIQVYCVDSIDCESFYSKSAPVQRIARHLQYEKYILQEVVPLSESRIKKRD
jgi:esterase/lipase superfamily enzyme